MGRQQLQRSVSFSNNVSTHEIPSLDADDVAELYYSRADYKKFQIAQRVRIDRCIAKQVKRMVEDASATLMETHNQELATMQTAKGLSDDFPLVEPPIKAVRRGSTLVVTDNAIPTKPVRRGSTLMTTDNTIPIKPVRRGSTLMTTDNAIPIKPVRRGSTLMTTDNAILTKPVRRGSALITTDNAIPTKPVRRGSALITTDNAIPTKPVRRGSIVCTKVADVGTAEVDVARAPAKPVSCSRKKDTDPEIHKVAVSRAPPNPVRQDSCSNTIAADTAIAQAALPESSSSWLDGAVAA
jgi:hypothetical protein